MEPWIAIQVQDWLHPLPGHTPVYFRAALDGCVVSQCGESFPTPDTFGRLPSLTQ